MTNHDDLHALIASRHPLILAQEQDEMRFLGIVRAAAQSLSLPVWTWSATHGLCRDGFDAQYGTKPAPGALAFISALPDPAVFVMVDVHPALSDPLFVRSVKDFAEADRASQTLILASPQRVLPPELTGIAIMFALEPPATEELESVVAKTLEGLTAKNLTVAIDAEQRASLVEAVRGVSATEAERLIQEAALEDGRLDADDIVRIREGKAKLLEGGGVLELVDTAGSLDLVGGMTNLKEWLALRGKALQPAAAAFGLDPPRGVLLTGVPGCGKSLVAKTLAGTWGYPLVLLDPARLYGPYVGQSEERLQQALTTVESMAPAVLWIDEIEKGFAQGGEGDGGVSARVLGTFLRWMQDRPAGVFVIATANEVTALPPEFLRKGRFDEIFFVDLPAPEERQAIFKIQLAKRKRDPAAFDLAKLAEASDGFSGSEIEAALVGAMYKAFADGADLSTDGIVTELGATEPLSRTRGEDIARLRAWAVGRAVPV